MTAGNTFEEELNLSTGQNTIAVRAEDGTGNVSNYTFRTDIAPVTARNFTYDADGNMTSDGIVTYEWDCLNRLTRINRGGTKATRFYYNALGQRIVIGELDGTTFTDMKFLSWDGIQLLSLRKGPSSSGYTGAKYERRYYPQGEQTILQDAATGNLTVTATHHYTRDHLGSIREVVKTDGTLQARYDYDPYGKRIAQYESTAYGTCPFGYTGHFTQKSPIVGQGELVLTHFRAYDPELGRWLSADPIGEAGGINLYGYVTGNPINGWDPYGLEFWAWNGTAGAWAENVTTFAAGYSDSATFGLTGLARGGLYRNYGGDTVDKCSDSYKSGQRTQIATDVATLGASGGLKLALKAKGKSVARAEANLAIRGLPRTQHHINTVIGHPGGIGSYFPTGGLPALIHSHKWNLRQVDKAKHLSLHRRARKAENLAMGSASLVGGRLDRNGDQTGCD